MAGLQSGVRTHHVLPQGPVPQKVIPESLQGPHLARWQHGLPGAQLLVPQPSSPQLPQLLQPQLLIRRVPRHVAGELAQRDTARARTRGRLLRRAPAPQSDLEDTWERRAVMTSHQPEWGGGWSRLLRGSQDLRVRKALSPVLVFKNPD